MIQDVRLKWFIAIVMLTLPAAAAQAEIIIHTVPVGNPGNTADGTGYGAVSDPYNIGKYEVTAGQYTEFLNAVAATDTHGLYNTSMDSNSFGCQITRHGDSGSYTYDFSGRPSGTAADWENRPVNYVSFWDTARFCNWLQNGQPSGVQGSGTTEDGAYLNIDDQVNFAREDGALFFIPTEDEWYKAAYHDKSAGLAATYFDYQTRSDSAPSNDLDLGGNNATFYDSGYTDSTHYRTEVGGHENSESPYGTFDQGGNVWEWNEAVVSGSYRGLRGGSFADVGATHLGAEYRSSSPPTYERLNIGFRVASSAAIPEPGSLAMLAGLAVMGLVWWRRRK